MRINFAYLLLSAMLALFGPDTQPAAPIQSAIHQIDVSTDPSAIVEAYSNGLAIDRDNVELLDAFVQKMVQLDLPTQASAAAERLLAIQPNNATARIVVADAQARRGEMIDAMTNLAIAAPKLADDKFAQQIAARLFAWYDDAPQKPALPASIQPALDQIRHDWQDLTTYRVAYQQADEGYKKASASTEPMQNAATENYVEPTYVPSPQTYEATDNNTYQPVPSYPNYYESAPYYPPSYDYPYSYYDSYPFFYPSVVIVNRHDHHRHDFQGGHDGGRNWGSDGVRINNVPKVGERGFMGPVNPGNVTSSRGRSVESAPHVSVRSSPRATVSRPAPAASGSGRGGGHR